MFSYDGGVSIYIKNQVLFEILDRYKAQNAFTDGAFMIGESNHKGVTYDFVYEYLDCAYISQDECPSQIEEVAECILNLFDVYEEENPKWKNTRDELLKEFTKRKDEIVNGYEIVKWIYYIPDGEYDEDENETGEIAFKYRKRKPRQKK